MHKRKARSTSGAAVAGAVVVLAAADAASARTVVRIADRAVLHTTPGGAMLRTDRKVRTEHGSVWVVRRRGAWLGIPTLHTLDGELGWIRKTPARRLATTRLLVTVDLSARRIQLTHGARLLLTAPAAIGAPRSPTPTGSTSVSKRISVTPRSGYGPGVFGPIILPLRLWQPLASPGLPHGGIVAIHGGDDRTVGTASTAGCVRMRAADLRRLARFVRAGTPVIIRR